MKFEDWDDPGIDEQEAFDAWEEAFLEHLRELQEEEAKHDKIRIANPKRMKEFIAALRNLKPVLAPYLKEVNISTDVAPLSKAGTVRITLPEAFATSNLAGLCKALSQVDNMEIGVAFNRVYIDLLLYNITKTEFMN